MSETQSISGEDFFRALRARGYDFFSGVPCSLFEGLYPVLESQTEAPLISAVREDDALSHASGAWMAGKKPVMLMQNSGLGNSLNVLISLNESYQIPVLVLISWRGFEGKDAPEHIVMGPAMTSIFDSVGLPWQALDPAELEKQLDEVEKHFTAGKPSMLIVKKGVIS